VSYFYNAAGLLANAVDVQGRTNSYVYETKELTSGKTKNLLVSKRLANGMTVTIVRDGYGRVTKVSDNAGNSKAFQYSYNSSLKVYYSAVTASDGKFTEHWVDSSGDETKQTVNGETLQSAAETNAASFAADRTVYEYNGPYGEVTKTTDAAGMVTAFAYDSRGNLTTQIVAVGTALAQETRYTYDDVGNRLSETVMGTNGEPRTVTLMAYDTRGNVTQRVEAAGSPCARTTAYTCDNLGNVLTQADALGHTWSNRYDAAGRLLVSVSPLQGGYTVSNVYDEAGHVAPPHGTPWDAEPTRCMISTGTPPT